MSTGPKLQTPPYDTLKDIFGEKFYVAHKKFGRRICLVGGSQEKLSAQKAYEVIWVDVISALSKGMGDTIPVDHYSKLYVMDVSGDGSCIEVIIHHIAHNEKSEVWIMRHIGDNMRVSIFEPMGSEKHRFTLYEPPKPQPIVDLEDFG